MRKATFLSLMAVLLAGAPASATVNCAASTGGGTCCGGGYWYEYSAETLGEGYSQLSAWQCWTGSGGSGTSIDSGMLIVQNTAFWNLPGFEVHGFSQHAIRTFTVPNDGYYGHWEADLRVDLVDPHLSWYNQLDARLSVYHPGSGTTTYGIYYHNGTQGNDRGRSAGVNFSAQAGDIITIDIMGTWSGDSDSHTQFFDARLFHFNY